MEALPGVYDQLSYHALASRVVDGSGFSFATDWWPSTKAGQPTAHWSFAYTLYLAFFYLILGENALIPRIVQVFIVAILHPWLTWRIGRRVFGEEAGLVAAVSSAVYGYFVYYSGALVTESFYILTILWILDLATGMSRSAFDKGSVSRYQWLMLGIALGLAVLLRQLILLFTPLLFGWLLLAFRAFRRNSLIRHREIVVGILITSLALAMMIVPWTVRNYHAFGRFVLLNTNAGFAFFWGNHPAHGNTFIPIFEDSAQYGRMIPRELRNLDEASLERELLKKGVSFVVQDPLRYVRLTLSRTVEYFKFWPSAESSLASNMVRIFSFGFFFPLMLLGLVVAAHQLLTSGGAWDPKRTGFFKLCNLLLILFTSFYTGLHLLTWALIRYRLPVDSVLLIYAGFGTIWLLHRLPLRGLWPARQPVE